MTSSGPTAQVLSWGMGEPIAGTPFRKLIRTAETEGRVAMLAVDMPPGEHVDEHTHVVEDSIIVVIEGTVGATVGGREYKLAPGSVLLMPRGVPHAQWNAGPSVAKVLEMFTPGGFETVFERAGQLARAGHPVGAELFRRVRDEWAASHAAGSLDQPN